MTRRRVSEKDVRRVSLVRQGVLSWLKARTWHDGVFVLLALAMFFVSLSVLGEYQSLRSPLYGGDFYNHLGGMYHLKEGGSFFEGWDLLDTRPPWAPMFYHLMVVLFSSLTGLSLIDAVNMFAVALVPVKMLIFYVMGVFVFRSKYAGLLMAGLASATSIMKHNPFAYEILIPLLFLFLFLYHTTRKKRYMCIAGLWYGLIGITHTIGFISISLFMMIYVLILLKEQVFSREFLNPKKFLLRAKALLKKTELVDAGCFVLVGVPLAMLYWFWPIFVYQGHTLNQLHIYAIPDYAKHAGHFFTSFLSSLFFDFSSWYRGLATLGRYALVIGGLFTKLKHKDFFLILVVAGLVTQFHFLITSPFFGFQFVPTDFGNFVWHAASIIGIGLLFMMLLSFGRRIPYILPLLFGVFAIITFTHVYAFYDTLSTPQWSEDQPLNPLFLSLQSRILEQTSVYDVILAGNENSFMINALTGRKVVTTRRTHASPYVDLDQRMLDAAVILYGNDTAKTRELLEAYSVDYVYWDQRSLRNEYTYDEQGNVVGMFDPLSVLYTPEKEAYLKKYGIPYFVRHGYFTPTYDEMFPTYDVLYMYPPTRDPQKHWSDTLYPLLVENASLDIGGQRYWVLYRVVPPVSS